MTHTHANLEVSDATYSEIRRLLKAAGYDHAFGPDGTIDMHGIALVREPRTKVEMLVKNIQADARRHPRFAEAMKQLQSLKKRSK
jgi:hypothetical protein